MTSPKLLEISAVPVPANAEALATVDCMESLIRSWRYKMMMIHTQLSEDEKDEDDEDMGMHEDDEDMGSMTKMKDEDMGMMTKMKKMHMETMRTMKTKQSTMKTKMKRTIFNRCVCSRCYH